MTTWWWRRSLALARDASRGRLGGCRAWHPLPARAAFGQMRSAGCLSHSIRNTTRMHWPVGPQGGKARTTNQLIARRAERQTPHFASIRAPGAPSCPQGRRICDMPGDLCERGHDWAPAHQGRRGFRLQPKGGEMRHQSRMRRSLRPSCGVCPSAKKAGPGPPPGADELAASNELPTCSAPAEQPAASVPLRHLAQTRGNAKCQSGCWWLSRADKLLGQTRPRLPVPYPL